MLRISVDSSFVLSEPLAVMKVAVSTRPVVAELSCVKLFTENSKVSYFATTGHLSLYNPVTNDAIIVEEPGSALVSYDLLVAALSSIVGPLTVHTTDKNMIITSTKNRRSRRRLPLADLDALPEPVSVGGTAVLVPAEKLREVIQYVAFAAIKDGSRPELRGMLIGDTSMCGDGTRLACYSLNTDVNITMSFEAVMAIQQVLPSGGDVSLLVDRWILVCFPDGKELRFAGTADIFPDSAKSVVDMLTAKVPIATLSITTSSLHRVFSAVGVYTEKATKFGIAYVEVYGDEGQVYVKTEVPSVGLFEDVLECSYSGKDFTVLVAPQHIMDILNSAKSESLEIKVYSSLEPLLISDPATDGWKVVQGVMATASMHREEVEEDDF